MKSTTLGWALAGLALLATLPSCPARQEPRLEAAKDSQWQGLDCPASCATLFKKLNDGVQETRVQIRGEPKSGTGTSTEWAAAALHGACWYLQTLYGSNSCAIAVKSRDNSEIVFEPRAASSDGHRWCSCPDVERATFSVEVGHKHELPIKKGTCSYWHPRGIVWDTGGPCKRKGGQPVENQVDLWKCIQEADCSIIDNKLQLVPIRDPRPMAVSAYYHLKRTSSPQVWRSQSELFWYGDHEADPLEWHGRYLAFIGLNLPVDEVVKMARTASGGDVEDVLGYETKGIDRHVGGLQESNRTSFRDEIGTESLEMMDDVLRTWLPPVILKRLEVPL